MIGIISGLTTYDPYELQKLLQQQILAKSSKAQNIAQSGFRERLRTESSTHTNQSSFQPSMQASVSSLKEVITRIDQVREYIWDLLSLETLARTASADELAVYVTSFDTAVRNLNSIADQTVTPPNLIGSDFANDLSYVVNSLNDRTYISHTDLSTAYTIVETGGNTWEKANSATDGTLLQYTSDGALTGTSVEVTQKLRLDSLSGDTISFTIEPGAQAEQSFVGATLSTDGLNVLDSWGYAGLATADGRSRAETALKSAMTIVDVQDAVFNGALARAKFDLGLAEVASDSALNNISSINYAQLLALQEISDAGNREVSSTLTAFSRNLAMLRAYQNMFDTAISGNRVNVTA